MLQRGMDVLRGGRFVFSPAYTEQQMEATFTVAEAKLSAMIEEGSVSGELPVRGGQPCSASAGISVCGLIEVSEGMGADCVVADEEDAAPDCLPRVSITWK